MLTDEQLSINRTIFGIETAVVEEAFLELVKLSIAPSLELKQNVDIVENVVFGTINRTIFGIETIFAGAVGLFVCSYQSHHLWN